MKNFLMALLCLITFGVTAGNNEPKFCKEKCSKECVEKCKKNNCSDKDCCALCGSKDCKVATAGNGQASCCNKADAKVAAAGAVVKTTSAKTETKGASCCTKK